MTTTQEREVIQEKTKAIIVDACGGDVDAQAYLWMIARITRTLDDIYDADQEVTRNDLLEVLEYLFVRMPTNVFYCRHQHVLLSQHISMYNALMAANLVENGDETDKIYAHVWRDTHHELIPIVALLTQGYQKMQIVSLEIRKTFKNKLGE